ncbi:hypothetical protein HHL22_22320 [Hymenobacter sp. RP-2-7]|uniref:Lipoprotein n=1 Tax=Hymenobacter polaris TaxID=2682546 RepID=A0A7Y0AIJ0_9BACT|nr:hypothetical protein [Hymenobacter polaris]NML67945.1 hypothetical protein [Hymenobacter polaris]
MKHLLLAIGEVATLAGCSKKEGPAPEPGPTAGTATYQRDGQTVNCQATIVRMPSIQGMTYYDILEVVLTTIPQPAIGSEVLYVNYYGTPGVTKASSFYLEGCTLVRNGAQYTTYSPTSYTLVNTSGGGYSGSFAGAVTAPDISTISGGIFTDVRL